MSRARSILITLALLAQVASAQSLVTDIATGTQPTVQSSDPTDVVRAGDAVFFEARNGLYGRELWRSDGTPQGTWLVKDVWPGPSSSGIGSLTATGDGELYFVASDPAHDDALWVSDGTATGTTVLFDPGDSSFSAHGFTRFGDHVYFFGRIGLESTDLWRTDGTEAGTEVFLPLGFGGVPFPALGRELLAVGSQLYFTVANSPTLGGSLWVTDGTIVGLRLLEAFDDGTPAGLTAVGDTVFVSQLGGDTPTLWKSDGTGAGTVPVVTLAAIQLTPFGGRLYFAEASEPGQLWSTDGTPAGTSLVVDIAPAGDGLLLGLTEAASHLWFRGSDGSVAGSGVWTSDGTATGTLQVAQLDGFGGGFAELDGLVYFAGVTDFGVDSQLWRSDGTPGGTGVFSEVTPGDSDPTSLVGLDSSLFFVASDASLGTEPWVTDGTLAGTTLLRDIAPPVPQSSTPLGLVQLRDLALFSADDGVAGRELWRSDGTEAGTDLVLDIRPGPDSSAPHELFPFGDRVLFVATSLPSVVAPDELWVTDGTAGGTERVSDAVEPGGALLSEPAGFALLDGFAYFAGTDFFGSELWRTDGTASGTQLVAEVDDSAGFLDLHAPAELTPFDGRIFHTHFTMATGVELFVSDGTEAGTGLFADLLPGAAGSHPRDLVVSGGALYFTADDGVFGRRLWRSDGSPAGTAPIALVPGFTQPSHLRDLNGSLVFQASSGLFEGVLRTDGTPSGTTGVKVVDVSDGAEGFVGLFDVFGELLFFTLEDDEGGSSLWRSDGTASGTQLVKTFDEVLAPLADVDGVQAGSGTRALFTAYTEGFGIEPWVSDGTFAGTFPLADVAPATGNSSPAGYARAGDWTFFRADDGENGVELHAIPFVETGGYVTEPFGAGCPGTGGLVPAIGAEGPATVGETFDATLANALPASAALLLVSLDPSPGVDVGFGCAAYLGTLVTTATATTDANGAASVPLLVPTSAATVGLQATLQWVVADPNGAFGGLASLSDGLEVLVGP